MRAGAYLSPSERDHLATLLCAHYAMPFAPDLSGEAFEEILAEVKGTTRVRKQTNRPFPDIMVGDEGWSVKTERLSTTRDLWLPEHFLGRSEDIIVARPKVDDIIPDGEAIATMDTTDLGRAVMRYFNHQIVRGHGWDRMAFLLRVAMPGGAEGFIYFERETCLIHRPDKLTWTDTGRATGENRNIQGHRTKSGPSEVRWNSGGKQLYVRYAIPHDAEILAICPKRISMARLGELVLSVGA